MMTGLQLKGQESRSTGMPLNVMSIKMTITDTENDICITIDIKK